MHFQLVLLATVLCINFNSSPVISASSPPEHKIQRNGNPSRFRFIPISPIEISSEISTYSGSHLRSRSTPSPTSYLQSTAAKEYFKRCNSPASRWILTSSSQVSQLPKEVVDEWEITSILSNDLVSSHPFVEFFIHRPDSSPESLNRHSILSETAFHAPFPLPFDSSLLASILTVLERDFYLAEMFLLLSVIHCEEGHVEVVIFTKIDKTDFETIDRLMLAFSRYPALRKFFPASSREIIPMRPESKKSDQIWPKFMSLLSNLPKSPSSIRSAFSTKSSPNSVSNLSANSSPRSIFDGISRKRSSSSPLTASWINPDLIEDPTPHK